TSGLEPRCWARLPSSTSAMPPLAACTRNAFASVAAVACSGSAAMLVVASTMSAPPRTERSRDPGRFVPSSVSRGLTSFPDVHGLELALEVMHHFARLLDVLRSGAFLILQQRPGLLARLDLRVRVLKRRPQPMDLARPRFGLLLRSRLGLLRCP